MKTVYTHCQICLASCGLEIEVDDTENRVLRISPDKQNPYTWMDFCAKGRTAAEAVEHPRRLLTPMRRVGDRYVEATWDEAITDIAAKLNSVIERHGPDGVGVYWGNPVAHNPANSMFWGGLMDAIGTTQRYFPTSVDTNTYHVVAQELYGSPFFVLPPDVDDCDCFLLVGMNPAVSAFLWIEYAAGGWRRVLERQAQGADVILVDPRRTESAEKAGTHLAIRPGQDWALLLGMLKVIFAEGWEHTEDCRRLVGLDEVRRLAADADLEDLAARCEIPADVIADVARRFATARTAMAMSHTGVAQHTTGTMGEWFSHLLNLVTGRVDRPGGRRFERGYVDTMALFDRLAPPMDGLSRVRGLPYVAGTHAMAELADEITTPGPGQIHAMIINSGNPVNTGPNGSALDKAIESLEFLVVVDLVQRESHRHADWLIPGTHWLERDDLFTLASQMHELPFVQLSWRAVDPPAGVRPEWSFWVDLAMAMRRPLFGKRGINSFIKATRRLATLTRRPGLAFDPMWVDRLLVAWGRRVKWRDIMSHPHGFIFADKEFGHFDANLRTPDKKVHAAPPQFVAEARSLLRSPRPGADPEYPLLMLSRRHKHTMNSWVNDLPSLLERKSGNDVEINPVDAARYSIGDGDLVLVESPVGSVELIAVVSDAIRPGAIVIEQGWGSRVFDPTAVEKPQNYGVNRNLLVSDVEIDPLSLIPALNSQPVRVTRLAAAVHRIRPRPCG